MHSALPTGLARRARTRFALGVLALWPLLGPMAASIAAPPKPPHDLWLEGESCTDHDFTVIGRDPAFEPCYGSAILQLQTRAEAPADGYHATFRSALPAAGWWELRLAITRTGVPHLSPFTVEVSGYAPRRVCDFPTTTPYGPGDIFAWLTFGSLELPAGEVAVTIRCHERRATEGDYLVYVDALAWRQVAAPPADRWWIGGLAAGAAWALSRDFACEGPPRQALLTVACEGTAEVALNGTPVGRAAGVDPAAVLPVPSGLLREGSNAIRVQVQPQGPEGGLLAWLTVAGERGGRRLLLATDGAWQTPDGPVRVLGHARRPPWGDLTVQPVPRIPAGRLPIPVKTGNLSVDLIMAAARGQPRPEPHPSPEFDRYRDLAGISSVEDYLCWLPLEPERDRFHWEYYERNAAELEARGMGYAVYPWLHFVPEWLLRSEFWEPLRCLDHGETTFAPSIWSPATLTLFDRFYGALRGRLGDRVKAIYVSTACDYGEIGYPIGMADWVVPAAHKHPGFWCGDARARQDFAEKALTRYGGLAAVNAAWGTDFAETADIAYPPWTVTEGPAFGELQALAPTARAQARRRWLDFVEWYLQAMVDFAGKAVAISRRHYPEIPHEIKIGFGSERVMYGGDYTAFVARSRADGYTVRSTHGKLPPYFYRRFSSAARHYGVPLVTEPPSGVSRDEEVERIFKEAVSGTTEYFDYPQNLLDATDLFARFGQYLEGRHSLTDVAFFFPTTDHRLRPGQQIPPRLWAACEAATDRFDYSILDERLIRDGALNRERVLIIVEGSVIEADVLARIEAWIEQGGLLLVAGFGSLETVEGDTAWEDRCLMPLAGLPSAGSPQREQTPAEVVRSRLDLERIASACVRRLGRGATVRTPFGPEELKPFLDLAGELAWEPGRVVPWAAPGAPRLDGLEDGVWCALLPNRVLLCNTRDVEVTRPMTLDPEALRRAGAAAPAATLTVALTLPGHTLTSVELPSGAVLAP